MKKFSSFRAAVLTIVMSAGVLLSACGSAASSGSTADYAQSAPAAAYGNSNSAVYMSEYDMAEEAAVEAPAEMKEAGFETASDESEQVSQGQEPSAEQQAQKKDSRKLIKTMYYEVETENLEELDAQLQAKIDQLGGYVQDSSIDGGSSTYAVYDRYGNITGRNTRSRYANYTIRIPAERIDEFADVIAQRSNVLSRSLTVEDITLQYVDTDSRREALEVQERSLLEMMEKAESVQEMIEIQKALTDVRYELQNIKSRLKVYDNQVMYATIHLNVREVEKFTEVEPVSDRERLVKGFKENLGDLVYEVKEAAISFVINLPHIVLWVVILVIAFVIIRAIVRRSREVNLRKPRLSRKERKELQRRQKLQQAEQQDPKE